MSKRVDGGGTRSGGEGGRGRAGGGVVCVFSSLLLSSWARYFSQPLRRTLSPSRSRNSSNAGPELSLLYMSSSELCPARQYITPTFRWKFSCIGRQRIKEKSLDCNICIFIASFHLNCQDFSSIHFSDHSTSYFTFLLENVYFVEGGILRGRANNAQTFHFRALSVTHGPKENTYCIVRLQWIPSPSTILVPNWA